MVPRIRSLLFTFKINLVIFNTNIGMPRLRLAFVILMVAPSAPVSAERVALRGGCYMMGAAEGGFCEERPAHPVCIDSFEIDATEVTNAEYGRCVAAGACRPTGWPRSGQLPAPREPVTE